MFRHDVRNYGWQTAFFNWRVNLAWDIAKLLIRRPLKLRIK